MNKDNDNKGMQQVKGGVFAQEDIELLKKALEFYLKNQKNLDNSSESKISLLFHRLGRMGLK
tara:strand:+ start:1362 stop:1547 length:186 start_codon:yes stop_codon:yes gene_type:complete